MKLQHKKSTWIGIAILALIISFSSCDKHNCDEGPASPCQTACEKIPMMGWCGTPPVEFKYYYNPATAQCEEYIHVGDDIPFETLQECQDCACSRYVGQDKN